MKEEQRGNEEELQPTIQVKHLPLLLRPKQTCELFAIGVSCGDSGIKDFAAFPQATDWLFG